MYYSSNMYVAVFIYIRSRRRTFLRYTPIYIVRVEHRMNKWVFQAKKNKENMAITRIVGDKSGNWNHGTAIGLTSNILEMSWLYSILHHISI